MGQSFSDVKSYTAEKNILFIVGVNLAKIKSKNMFFDKLHSFLVIDIE
jgi:hypothetical protein